MVAAYIGIGGNLGNREANIKRAVGSLSECLSNIQCSQFYKTEPMDYLNQDYFLNVVVKGNTNLSPLELLDCTQKIEYGGGRVRDKKIPKGPRTIDLDILLYGREIIHNERLNIPHISMKLRKFVLIPLLELSGDIKDPLDGISYYKHLDKIEYQGVYCSSLYDYNYLLL